MVKLRLKPPAEIKRTEAPLRDVSQEQPVQPTAHASTEDVAATPSPDTTHRTATSRQPSGKRGAPSRTEPGSTSRLALSSRSDRAARWRYRVRAATPPEASRARLAACAIPQEQAPPDAWPALMFRQGSRAHSSSLSVLLLRTSTGGLVAASRLLRPPGVPAPVAYQRPQPHGPLRESSGPEVSSSQTPRRLFDQLENGPTQPAECRVRVRKQLCGVRTCVDGA
jgi:hypothetical protein